MSTASLRNHIALRYVSQGLPGEANVASMAHQASHRVKPRTSTREIELRAELRTSDTCKDCRDDEREDEGHSNNALGQIAARDTRRSRGRPRGTRERPQKAPAGNTPAPDARDTYRNDRLSQPLGRPRGTRRQSMGKPPRETRDKHKAAHEGHASGQGLRRRGTRRHPQIRNSQEPGTGPCQERAAAVRRDCRMHATGTVHPAMRQGLAHATRMGLQPGTG